ncbi:MAG: hypothetical protein QM621_01465 [Aeromicrobium sp.]|uniref:hypothetical protein n=1 Tax=Aeromicrobium sp. TaxID=1871063 RepID=UPI0039E4BF60
MDEALCAWIDESVEVSATRLGFYVLAATVCARDTVAPAQATLHELLPRNRQRLHWHAEDNSTRIQICRNIAALAVVHVVVITDAKPHQQERSRRKCLERLLFELDQLGVAQVWIESRQRAQDRSDVRMIDALRSRHAITPRIRVGFSRPLTEPMLWLPDSIAGMTTADLRSESNDWTGRLGSSYQLVDLRRS